MLSQLCFSLAEPNNRFYLYLSNLISFFIGREAVSCQHCQGKYFIYSKYFLVVYLLKVGFQFLERNPLVAAVLIGPICLPDGVQPVQIQYQTCLSLVLVQVQVWTQFGSSVVSLGNCWLDQSVKSSFLDLEEFTKLVLKYHRRKWQGSFNLVFYFRGACHEHCRFYEMFGVLVCNLKVFKLKLKSCE